MRRSIVGLICALSILIVLVSCIPPPSPVTVALPTATTGSYPILKAIGSTSLSTVGSNDQGNPQAYNIAAISKLRSFPAGVISTGPFQYGGIIATDLNYVRALYYRSPINITNDSGDVVFAQPSFTSTADSIFLANNAQPNTIEVARAGPAVVFSDQNRAFIYNMSIYNDQGYPPVAEFPGAVVGDCTNCTYAPYTSGTGLAADPTRVYFANAQCAQILVWNTTDLATRGNRAEPFTVLGQAAISRACPGATGCSTTATAYTCVTPSVMTTDCYNGLWVFDRATRTFLHFQQGSRVADLSLNLTISNPNSISMSFGNRCSYMSVSTNGYQYIYNVAYSGTVPTGATAAFTFGSGSATPAVGASTDNIGYVTSSAWDESNPDYLFVSDQANNRIVYFTPFAQTAASLSSVPSQTASISLTNSRSVSPSRTVSLTATQSITPSITPTLSVSSTPGLTSTATPSTTASFSISPGTVLVNASSDSSQVNPTTGSASSLSSWTSLLF